MMGALADGEIVARYQWIDAQSEVKRGVLPMSEEKDKPDEGLSELAKSSEQEPGDVNPPSRKTAEERFAEQVQALLHSVDPSRFNDTWEGCGGDAPS
jgi:hypothetical protein